MKLIVLFLLYSKYLFATEPLNCAAGMADIFRHQKDQEVLRRHEEITRHLYNGQLVYMKPLKLNDNRTTLFVGELSYGNKKIKVIIKPRVWGDNDGWNRTPAEYVAYELNHLLGMDWVPPAAYRKNFGGYSEVAVMYFAEDARSLYKVDRKLWLSSKEAFLSDTRILDVLLQNSDRHKDNFLWAKHWVDFQYRPLLIDHAASFRSGAYVTLEHENAFLTGPTLKIREKTYFALKTLTEEMLTKHFKEFLSNNEIKALLSRRDGIIKYFDGRILLHGADKVLLKN